jgi:hypothetical protein
MSSALHSFPDNQGEGPSSFIGNYEIGAYVDAKGCKDFSRGELVEIRGNHRLYLLPNQMVYAEDGPQLLGQRRRDDAAVKTLPRYPVARQGKEDLPYCGSFSAVLENELIHYLKLWSFENWVGTDRSHYNELARNTRTISILPSV